MNKPESLSFHDLKVLDFHVHFPMEGKPGNDSEEGYDEGEDYQKQYNSEETEEKKSQRKYYYKEWLKAWCFQPPLSETSDKEGQELDLQERIEAWSDEVEKYDFLEKVGFVTGGGNEKLSSIVEKHPDKFVGFAHHSPFEDNAASKLRKAVEDYGMRGYKILPPHAGSLADPDLNGLWETARDLDIPVLIHFGALGAGGGRFNYKNNSPLSLEPVAQRFPTLEFVVPHFGAGFHQELLYLSWACRNIYVDTSGCNNWVHWTFNLTLEQLFRKFLETVGPERIVFGSDSNWFPRGFSYRYLTEQVRIARFLNLSDRQTQMIFGDNAAKLLNLSDS